MVQAAAGEHSEARQFREADIAADTVGDTAAGGLGNSVEHPSCKTAVEQVDYAAADGAVHFVPRLHRSGQRTETEF